LSDAEVVASGADPWDLYVGESVDHPDKLRAFSSNNAAHILSSFSVGMNPSGSLVRVRFLGQSIRFKHTNTKYSPQKFSVGSQFGSDFIVSL
jgi:hypothetical protein